MNYTKTSLTIQDQITLLQSRGLKIRNSKLAATCLSNISYYRLSAYLLSFQKYGDSTHTYMPWATFDKVLRLYVFDRELRLTCLDAIERIEVAVRCRLSQEYSTRYGNNWFEDPTLYTSPTEFSSTLSKIKSELSQSKEVFIQHYRNKYTHPKNPPSWMTIEVLSFGALSKMYKVLGSNDAKKSVADYFGVSTTILASWLETLSYLRNLCAHHSRLWNRTLTKKPQIPTHPARTWITIPSPKKDKLYTSLCVLAYILKISQPKHPFNGKLRSLISKFPDVNLTPAGFPKNWQKDLFWSEIHTPITHQMRIAFFRCKHILR